MRLLADCTSLSSGPQKPALITIVAPGVNTSHQFTAESFAAYLWPSSCCAIFIILQLPTVLLVNMAHLCRRMGCCLQTFMAQEGKRTWQLIYAHMAAIYKAAG